jgi:hypothetical protein
VAPCGRPRPALDRYRTGRYDRAMKISTAVVVVVAVIASVACITCDGKRTRSRDEVTKLKLGLYAKEAFPEWSAAHPDKACPDSLADLSEYMNNSDTNDAWGHPLKMFCGPNLPPGAKGLAVMSSGEDGKEGTEDDLKSWK